MLEVRSLAVPSLEVMWLGVHLLMAPSCDIAQLCMDNIESVVDVVTSPKWEGGYQ